MDAFFGAVAVAPQLDSSCTEGVVVVPDGATPQLGEASTVSLDIDPAADDFVWQKGYAWCLTTPEAASGCAVYNSQAGDLPELAVLPGPHLPERQPSSPAASAAAAPSKASPGHLLLCGNAMIFGAAMATGDVLCGRGSVGAWTHNFQERSSAAAESMTPVGAYVLDQHVFHRHPQNVCRGRDGPGWTGDGHARPREGTEEGESAEEVELQLY